MSFEITADTPIAALNVKQLEEIIKRVVNSSSQPAPSEKTLPPKNLRYEEAVVFLCNNGYNIAKSTLNKYVANRQVPFSRFGKFILFDGEELLGWAENNKVKQLTK